MLNAMQAPFSNELWNFGRCLAPDKLISWVRHSIIDFIDLCESRLTLRSSSHARLVHKCDLILYRASITNSLIACWRLHAPSSSSSLPRSTAEEIYCESTMKTYTLNAMCRLTVRTSLCGRNMSRLSIASTFSVVVRGISWNDGQTRQSNGSI